MLQDKLESGLPTEITKQAVVEAPSSAPVRAFSSRKRGDHVVCGPSLGQLPGRGLLLLLASLLLSNPAVAEQREAAEPAASEDVEEESAAAADEGAAEEDEEAAAEEDEEAVAEDEGPADDEEPVEDAVEEPEEMADEPDPEALDRLRDEIRSELREEIRDELAEKMEEDLDREREVLRAEVRESIVAGFAAQDREPERWVAEPPDRPAFFELDGYLRARGDVLINLDMNAGTDVHGQGLFPTSAHADSDTLTTANQRLRLDPVFNVSEDLRVRATVDVLDNLVWGQNPDSYPRNASSQGTPLLALSETQVTPMGGVNAARDSLMVKRAWAEVHTPFGWLHFGRMGSHWGLGMLVNDGDDLDSDHGTSVDRLMFVTPLGDDLMVPIAVDVLSSGPILRTRGDLQGQPFGLENRARTLQYLLAIARRDSDDEVRRQVLDGRTVVNYGFYNLFRRQVLDYVGPEPNTPRIFNDPLYIDEGLSPDDFVRRDALVYTPDIWFRLNTSRLRVEVEAAAVVGHVGNGLLREDGDPAEDTSVSIRQFGAVAQGEYGFMQQRLRLGFEAGFASGDRAPGMGARSAPGGRLEYPDEGAIDGRQFNQDPDLGPIDDTLNNFKFNSAYYVDEILWRRVIGQVTDAIYLKPTLSYDLAMAFGFDLSAIYSRAMFSESAPGERADLGLEINAGLRYVSRDGFVLRGVYGILFPFGGLELETDRKPEMAQIIRGVAAVTF